MTENPHHKQFVCDQQNLEKVQSDVLLSQILQPNASSEYGIELGFSKIKSVHDYREAVPLVVYEDIRARVDRMVSGEQNVLTAERAIAYFKTSGSLSQPKLIPVTTSLVRQKVGAFAVYWNEVYKCYPTIKTGTMVSNFADASEPEQTAQGVDICSESAFWSRRGRMLHSIERWPLPSEIRHVKDSRARLYATCRLLLQTPLHCIMCLNPSTLLQFCRVLQAEWTHLCKGLEDGTWGTDDSDIKKHLELDSTKSLSQYLKKDTLRAGELQLYMDQLGNEEQLKLVNVWPDLSLLICWQSPVVKPYLNLLAEYVEGVAIRDYITQSSECMMAIPMMDARSGGVLAYHSHFYEFIEEGMVELDQPGTVLSSELIVGNKYEIVVTTGGGLYRYRMGDCIRVTGFDGKAPVIEFLYRFGKTSSMTGEKLTEFQTLDASSKAAQSVGYGPEEYLMFPMTASDPGYGILIDIGDQNITDGSVLEWSKSFDHHLSQANSEYADKVASGRLSALRYFTVDRGELRKHRHAKRVSGVSEEQVKSEVLTRIPDLHLQFNVKAIES